MSEATESTTKPEEKKKEPKVLVEEPAVIRQGEVAGIRYTVETGRLPIKNEKDEIEALVFYHY